MIPREWWALKRDWLEQHRLADEIVLDRRTGEPLRAVYTRLDGELRDTPAIYPWPPEWATDFT